MNIILCGCNGKMGQSIVKNISNFENFNIVFGVDKNTNINNKFPVLDNLNKINNTDKNIDVLIDFSSPSNLDNILDYCLSTKIPAVICTTGFTDTQINKIEKASEDIPIFYSQNMSLGVNLLINLAKKAAEFLGSDFDIEIIEKHHNNKIDSPSGTAYMIANEINQNNKYNYVFDRTQKKSKREKNEIGIHSVRAGSLCGEHEIIFAGPNESISITHSAQSRDIFALGALKAAKFIINQKPGFYNINNLY